MKPTMSTEESLLLENQIFFPLYAAGNALVRAYRPFLDPLKITYSQYLVMLVLWQHSSMTVKELGQQLRLDSGTLTPLLKRLEGKGLVLRKRAEHDERARVISLTKQGQSLKKQATNIPSNLACKTGLSAAKGQQLKSLCEQLLEVLDSAE
jgi:DNA-binding MarR family transcriptional regulator